MAQQMVHAVESSTLADVLERVLDKGIVIAGDIKIKLCDIELLTIQIRLMIASVDKAKEIGMDWWVKNPEFSSRVRDGKHRKEMEVLRAKVATLERALPNCPSQAQRGGRAPRPMRQRVRTRPQNAAQPDAR